MKYLFLLNIKILFENEHLLVIDKPHFLTISPTGAIRTGNPAGTIKKTDRQTNFLPRFIV